MATTKKSGREDLVRDLFLTLSNKWDVHDKASARNLAKHCVEIVDGYYEVLDGVFAAKKPEKTPKTV
jgi:hypothetical protein